MNLRSAFGEVYLGVICRLLDHPLQSRLVSRFIYGPGLFPKSRVRYTMRQGMRMRLDLHDQISRMIYFIGSHEPEEAEFFRRIIQPDWVVFDVGAHVGYYTLLAARLIDASRGHVYAFEPNAEIFRTLLYHIQINGLSHVTPINTAAGATTGQSKLVLGPSYNTGLTSLLGTQRGERAFAVPVTTLDEFVDAHRLQRVDFVKMDVEGSEFEVLAGGRGVLASHRPRLMLEVNPRALALNGRSPRDVVHLLRDAGYAILRMDHPRVEMTLDEIEARGFVNVYCEPRQ